MHMTTYSEEKPLFDDHPTWDTSDKKWFEAIWQNTKSVQSLIDDKTAFGKKDSLESL